MSKFPFKQKRVNSNTLLRKFSKDVKQQDLVWHRDRCDRVVEVVSGNGWSLQLDNQVPRKLREGSRFNIRSGQYHRILKGRGDLVLRIVEAKEKDEEAGPKSTIKYNADPALKGDQTKLPDKLQKGIIDKKRKSKKGSKKEIDENKKSNHDPNYKAPEGSKRDKQLDATQADLASGDPERKARAWRRRERMERQANESLLRTAVREILAEELSKATEDKIRKVAEKRGMTFGSTKAEYKKGLAAWGTSGSRPGVSQHAWAMARINKANPSDDWSVIKKSKAKKK